MALSIHLPNFFAKHSKRANSPKFNPAKLSRYMVFVTACFLNTGQSVKFWSHFHHLSHHRAQTSVALENLDFTPDDLNQHFLSFADKIVQEISFTTISPHSFISMDVPVFQFTTA